MLPDSLTDASGLHSRLPESPQAAGELQLPHLLPLPHPLVEDKSLRAGVPDDGPVGQRAHEAGVRVRAGTLVLLSVLQT